MSIFLLVLNLTDIHFKHANQGQMELAKKCVGDERCVARGRRLLWNISPIYPKLGRVRHWFALMFLLAGAWVGCRGGEGAECWSTNRCWGSSFEVVMKRCHSESLYVPLSVSWRRHKGRAALATLMVLHMGCYTKRSRSNNWPISVLSYGLQCIISKNNPASIWWKVKTLNSGIPWNSRHTNFGKWCHSSAEKCSTQNLLSTICLPSLSALQFNRFIMLRGLSYQHLFNVKMFDYNFYKLFLIWLVAFCPCSPRNMTTATEQLMMTKDMNRMTTTTVIKDKSKFCYFFQRNPY